MFYLDFFCVRIQKIKEAQNFLEIRQWLYYNCKDTKFGQKVLELQNMYFLNFDKSYTEYKNYIDNLKFSVLLEIYFISNA